MKDQVSELEPAIPEHLRMERSIPSRRPEGVTPPFPTYVARFNPDTENVAMAFLGIQSATAEGAQMDVAVSELCRLLELPDGPGHWDMSEFIDQAGFTNRMFALYWLESDAFVRWRNSKDVTGWWESEERIGHELGYFLEAFTPNVTHYETHFSTARTEGIAALSDAMSGEIADHAYWGSARDRIPISQVDALLPEGIPKREMIGSSRRIFVRPHQNLCLIRSGQDWTDTDAKERSLYNAQILPHLEAGMAFLRDEGLLIGCFDNRFVKVLKRDGTVDDKSFGMSLWTSLAHLEKWASSHPTHLRIYGSLAGYMQKLGPTAGLRTYHEITVLPAEHQHFEYINCHDRTGMLKAS